MNQTNIIKRQILDFTLDSEKDSYAFQSKLSRIYYNDILPIIDEYCTALSDPSRIQRIERFEIDLGEIDSYNIESGLKEMMSEQFPEKLAVALQRCKEFSYKRTEDDSKVHIYDYIKNNMPVSYLVTPEHKDFELLVFFIKKGRLPWWIKKDDAIDIVKILEIEINENPEKIKNLMIEIAQDNNLIKRFVYQFPDKVLEKIVALIHGAENATYIKNIQQLNNIVQDLILMLIDCNLFEINYSNKIRYELWIIILSILFSSMNQISSVHDFVQIVIKQLSEKFNADYTEVNAYVRKELNKKGLNLNEKQEKDKSNIEIDKYIKQIILFKSILLKLIMVLKNIILKNEIVLPVTVSIENLENELQDIIELYQRVIRNKNGGSLINRGLIETYSHKLKAILIYISNCKISEQDKSFIQDILDIINLRNDITREDVRDRMNKNITKKILDIVELDKDFLIDRNIIPVTDQINIFSDSEEIYVNNAGIVLLWPYLNKFFKLCGLVKDNEFINQEKQERAVFLLQYCALGRMEFPEYNLMLNKILCGIDQERPLESNVYFTENEIQECHNLIEAIIQNWSALKNVSEQRLREMFFLREGMISIRDASWILRVEEKAYDVLIDKMPWGMSTIKLPWMQNFLFVEWRL